MVLAPFYQDFMKSLDEHINELVEVKCSRMMKALQYQINDLRRENRKLQRRLNVNGGEFKESNGQDFVPKLDAIEAPIAEVLSNESPQLVNGEGGSQLVNGVCKSEKSDEDFINITNGGDRMEEDDHSNVGEEEILDGEDDDDVTHFQEFNDDNDDCPDLEEIGNEKDDEDHDTYNRSDTDSYGEKTIDEKDMEKYFNDENFLCRLCNRQLCSRHSLMRHVKTVHTANRPYKCEYCNSSFKSADVKKVHVKNVHGALLDDKPYAKPYKNSPKKARLDLKDMINGNSNSLVVLQENGSLNNSLIPTNNEPKKIFSCSICKEKFSSRGEISGHSRRVHGNAKPFKCEYCDAGFTRIGTLNAHLKKHINTTL